MNYRAELLAILALVATQSVVPSQAQVWPQQTVKFIVPLGPGSGVDIVARLFADQLTARWGKPVVIENRPGGDGFVAITTFVGARDGHTLLFTPSAAFTAHPFLHEKLPYDSGDIVPVARVSNTLVGVGVPASLKVGSLTELVNLARAQPGKLNWAGITGALDFVFAGFLNSSGLNINKIPYRDGVQALNDLAEGRIEVYVTALAIMPPQIEAGKIKLIAIANHERAPSAPDIPTAVEAGYPTLTFDGLVGLFGPRDMTEEVRNRIAADIRAVASDPVIVTRLGATGQLVRPGNASEFAAAIDLQRSQITVAAKSLGVRPNQ